MSSVRGWAELQVWQANKAAEPFSVLTKVVLIATRLKGRPVSTFAVSHLGLFKSAGDKANVVRRGPKLAKLFVPQVGVGLQITIANARCYVGCEAEVRQTLGTVGQIPKPMSALVRQRITSSNVAETVAANVSQAGAVAVLDAVGSGRLSRLRRKPSATFARSPVTGRVADVVHVLVRSATGTAMACATSA